MAKVFKIHSDWNHKWPSADIIEEWESDSEDENVVEKTKVKKTVKPSLEKIEFVNAWNTTVENESKAKKPRKLRQSPRGCVLSWTAFCQALRFAHLKTNCCVLLRTNSAKLKTVTRPNGKALRKCILSAPYKPKTVLVHAVDATDDFPVVPEHTTVETPMNMSPENKAHFLAEKEAIHLDYNKEQFDCDHDTDQYYQTSRSHRSSAPSPKPSIPSRSHTTTRHKGKEIAKPITPPSETAFEEDNDLEQAQRDKDMQKNLALIAKYFKKIYKPTNNNLRTSSSSKNKNVDTTPRFKNDNQLGQFGNQRTVNVAAARENVGSKDSRYHKEKILLCKQAEQGVQLQAEQYDWLADMDEEVDEQEQEVHYSYMAKIQEQSKSVSNTCLVETDDSNVILDSPGIDDERVALANLISNLKLDVDENKKIQKQLMKENKTLAQELKECKAILAKTSKSLRESISVQDSCLVALQTK
uniref:Uncharacterized protein n=1 Tax=Tanacetum cinerariifolium TaxID=118510 RepID=A0A6L2MTH2_TANCI|nr:hypothetical protein [Tanacetum cinerariifolium]